MKVLVTGSNGLLGQHLSNLLVHENDVELRATSSGLNRIREVDHCYERLDITDAQRVQEVITAFQPDVVINTAAATNVDACEDDRKQCDAINHLGVKYLVNAFETLDKSPYFIHLSTDFIFDGNQKVYREDDEPNPISEYGKSKWLGEAFLMQSAYENYAVVRTSLVYGIGESLNKGNVFLWAMDKLRNGESLTIVDDQYRSPTYVNDLASACVGLTKKQVKGVINIAGPETLSMFHYIVKTAAYLKIDANKVQPISSKTLAQKAKRPPCSGLDISKARRQIDYNPTTFMASLAEMDGAS